ncbi:hypothetical protein E2C01_030907 [Portunus trituberculatus]|uniref:Uncharacterized protein n=1 Tax=Portunus trituberculatus TaxID=210409 RepID=A0A5B7EWN4_PORTR|nr:hypothetical protein [Portunus trituberculatus]
MQRKSNEESPTPPAGINPPPAYSGMHNTPLMRELRRPFSVFNRDTGKSDNLGRWSRIDTVMQTMAGLVVVVVVVVV